MSRIKEQIVLSAARCPRLTGGGRFKVEATWQNFIIPNKLPGRTTIPWNRDPFFRTVALCWAQHNLWILPFIAGSAGVGQLVLEWWTWTRYLNARTVLPIGWSGKKQTLYSLLETSSCALCGEITQQTETHPAAWDKVSTVENATRSFSFSTKRKLQQSRSVREGIEGNHNSVWTVLQRPSRSPLERRFQLLNWLKVLSRNVSEQLFILRIFCWKLFGAAVGEGMCQHENRSRGWKKKETLKLVFLLLWSV